MNALIRSSTFCLNEPQNNEISKLCKSPESTNVLILSTSSPLVSRRPLVRLI